MIKLCADIGSTHLGSKELAMQAIKIAKEVEVDILKFQLFNGEPYVSNGNIPLPYEWWPDLFNYALKINQPITASAFDDEGLTVLLDSKPCFVKFSHSNRHQIKRIERCLKENIHVVVSCNMTDIPKLPKEVTKLFCIPEYPVPFWIDFKYRFPPFEGFSDHTLGIHQTINALDFGASFIEKHMTLTQALNKCPDAMFALLPSKMRELVEEIQKRRNQHDEDKKHAAEIGETYEYPEDH